MIELYHIWKQYQRPHWALSDIQGQIIIDNINILKIPSHKIYLLRRKMGIVFQDFRLLFHKKVFDNVAIVLNILGTPRKKIRRRVFNALRMVNLHNKMWEYPSHLSYGEQQRVATLI